MSEMINLPLLSCAGASARSGLSPSFEHVYELR